LPAPLCGAGKNRQKKRNGSPRHRLADSAETPKEKRPFLFQKEFPRAQIRKARSVFFGVLPSIGQVAGLASIVLRWQKC